MVYFVPIFWNFVIYYILVDFIEIEFFETLGVYDKLGLEIQ